MEPAIKIDDVVYIDPENHAALCREFGNLETMRRSGRLEEGFWHPRHGFLNREQSVTYTGIKFSHQISKCKNLWCKNTVEQPGEECLRCEKLNDERGDE